MNSEVTVTSSTADKRKLSEKNGDDEPAQKILKASPENIKCIEDLCNILLNVRNKLNAVYQETGTKLKNSFESIQLFVPELKKDLSLPPMPIIAEPVQLEQPSQKLEPPSQQPEPPSQKPEPPSKTKKPLPSLSDKVVSKWSIRHWSLEPGLVELMPGKGIFVSEQALARCQLYKTDMRKFARALLPEVFSKKAFEKCTFSGNKNNRKPSEDRWRIRRGLDEYAREVFLEYVNQYAKEEGWAIVSRKLMFQALTDKVNSLRCRITGSRH